MTRSRRIDAGLCVVLLVGCLDWDNQLQSAGLSARREVFGAVTQPLDIRGRFSVELQHVDARGEPVGEVVSVVTQDELGHFRIPVEGAGPLRLVASGTCLLALPPLCRACVDGNTECWRESLALPDARADRWHVDVNSMTHVTAGRLRNLLAEGVPFADARAQAERELKSQLPLAGPLDSLPPAAELSLESEEYSAAYLLALTTLMRGAAGVLEMEGQAYLGAVRADLADDGVIDERLREALLQAQMQLELQPFNEALALLVGDALPDVRLALDEDADGVASAHDNCPYTSNPDYAAVRDVCYERAVFASPSNDGQSIGSTWDVVTGRAVDLDGDGDTDLVAPADPDNSVFLNDGRAGFEVTQFAYPYTGDAQRTATSIAIGELSGDAFPDILYAVDAQEAVALELSTGRGDGTFDTPKEVWRSPSHWVHGRIYAFALEDVNADGLRDVVGLAGQIDQPLSIGVWMTRRQEAWLAHITPTEIVSPPWSGTPRAKLLLIDSGTVVLFVEPASDPDPARPAQLYLLRGDGHGGFSRPHPLGLGDGCTARLAGGDWDADGHMDLALLDEHATQLQLAFGDGLGHFGDSVTTTIPPAPNAISTDDACPGPDRLVDVFVAGHFTGDAADDLAIPGMIFVTNDRSAPRASPLREPLYDLTAVADFDGNGQTDLIHTFGFESTLYLLGP
jgi:hypothetical protein